MLESEPDITFIPELHPIAISGVGADQYEHVIKDEHHNHYRLVRHYHLICFRRVVGKLATCQMAATE
jgi:hypothetical protein